MRHLTHQTDPRYRSRDSTVEGLSTALGHRDREGRCIGETKTERDDGRALPILGLQIEHSIPPQADSAEIVVAYEPIWAIGAGVTPTLRDVAEAHAFIRANLEKLLAKRRSTVRILYGGSVTRSNAAELTAVKNVNGVFVGGASLTCTDF